MINQLFSSKRQHILAHNTIKIQLGKFREFRRFLRQKRSLNNNKYMKPQKRRKKFKNNSWIEVLNRGLQIIFKTYPKRLSELWIVVLKNKVTISFQESKWLKNLKNQLECNLTDLFRNHQDDPKEIKFTIPI